MTDMSRRTHVEHVMGTVFSLSFNTTPDRATAIDDALCDAVAWLHEVDGRFTTYRDTSAWLDFVGGRLDLDDAHPDIRYVARRCDELERTTHGWFDPAANPDRPPDPAAFVKGWAAQRAAMILTSAADAVLVNGGGDIYMTRRQAPWQIGIQHPKLPGRLAATIDVQSGAVATSGSYERGSHIHDPKRHAPATGLASVTVVGPDLGDADAYSTALYASNGEDSDWFPCADGYAAYLIDTEGGSRTIGHFAAAA